ncbi:MAG: hypothetical protein H7831_10195 [Magnetococcus sp. WYHC-3]
MYSQDRLAVAKAQIIQTTFYGRVLLIAQRVDDRWSVILTYPAEGADPVSAIVQEHTTDDLASAHRLRRWFFTNDILIMDVIKRLRAERFEYRQANLKEAGHDGEI